MKNGAYIKFKYDRKTYRGRIAVENGNRFLCQSIMDVSRNLNNQFGHEFTWDMGYGDILRKNIERYSIKVVTKKSYDSHKDPLIESVFGYSITRRAGGYIEFGCGAVTLHIDEIHDFIKNYDEFKKISKRKEELEKEINEEYTKINSWLAGHKGLGNVIGSVRARSRRVENIDMEKLKRLFPIRKTKKQ